MASRRLGRHIVLWTVLAMLVAFLPPAGFHAAAGTSWTLEIVDGEAGAGRYPSIAMGPDGWPRISYWFYPDRELRYAWRDASGWHNSTVDSMVGPGSLGFGGSLAVDDNGIPRISYLAVDSTAQESVWYAYWDSVSSSWVKELVDDTGFGLSSGYTSLALNSSGSPRIAYIHRETGELLYASRVDTSWTVDVVGVVGCCRRTSLQIDSQDRAYIAYYDYVSPGLGYARWDGTQWMREIVEPGEWVGLGPSLRLDNADRPHIAYIDLPSSSRLKLATWMGTEWNITTVPNTLDVESPSLALNATGSPRIAYIHHNPQNLMYASWDGSAWQLQLIDDDYAIFHASLAVNSSETFHIAYYHRVGGLVGQLKYAVGIPSNDPPTSSLLPLAPYWWNSSPTLLGATAQDSDGTVTRVDLWYRFDGGTGWGSWTLYGSDSTSPWEWSFPFPDGEGRYEFYGLAFDGQDMEVKAAAAEASAGYDVTPPVSAALPVSPYWYGLPPLTVRATATDILSGVEQVTLLYRHAADNATWGGWTPFGTDGANPWSWTFPFPDGEGNYQFHTVATDVAGNVEADKDFPEAIAGYRIPTDLPLRNVTTTWDGATGVGLVWEEPVGANPNLYLIYRASTPTGFADQSPGAAYDALPAPATSWSDPEPIAPGEERYYILRSASANGTQVSVTSNTAGVYAGQLNPGLTVVSRPLEYFPWVDYAPLTQPNTVDEYRDAFNADHVQYMDLTGRWQEVPGTGSNPDTPLEVGKAYIFRTASVETFVFTGLPGAMLLYDEYAYAGFLPAGDALTLEASVPPLTDDVVLTFSEPQGMAITDYYEVYYATARTGFFDGTAQLVPGSPFAATSDPMTVTHTNALLLSDELYYIVVPYSSAGRGASTYSVGVWSHTFRGQETFALPLRPQTNLPIDWYCDAIPNVLGMLFLRDGVWVGHFREMPAGVFDTNVVLAAGYQITVSPTLGRFSFAGS